MYKYIRQLLMYISGRPALLQSRHDLLLLIFNRKPNLANPLAQHFTDNALIKKYKASDKWKNVIQEASLKYLVVLDKWDLLKM